MKIRVIFAAAAVCGFALTTHALAALVTNGNFAAPDESINLGTEAGPDLGTPNFIPNFTITGHAVTLYDSDFSGIAGFPTVPTAGEQTLMLADGSPTDGGANGGVETSLNLPLGEVDTVSFQIGGREGGTGIVAVTFDGVSEGNFQSKDTGAYQEGSFQVIGTGLPQVLAFSDASFVGGHGIQSLLQEVSVDAAVSNPEPSTLGLLGITQLGLLARRRRA